MISSTSKLGTNKFITCDKDLCWSLCENICTSPINIIELLPLVKQGIMFSETFFYLTLIKEKISGKLPEQSISKTINLHERLMKSMKDELTVIRYISYIFNENLLKKDRTIYNLIRILLSPEYYYEHFCKYSDVVVNFVYEALSLPKINPLLISILVGDYDMQKYFRDVRTGKIEVWKFCLVEGRRCLDEIKEEIIIKTFLCINLPYINLDLSKYIMSLEIF